MIYLDIPGKAQPAGSKRGFVNPKTGRVIITDAAAKSRPWKAVVSDYAQQAMGGEAPLEGPLSVRMTFFEMRPKGHFNSKGQLNAQGQRNPFPAKKPDLLKLARAVEDALTGIVYRDDAQIVEEKLVKAYGTSDHVIVTVKEANAPR